MNILCNLVKIGELFSLEMKGDVFSFNFLIFLLLIILILNLYYFVIFV